MSLETKLQSLQKHIALGQPHSRPAEPQPRAGTGDWEGLLQGKIEPLGDTASFSLTTSYESRAMHGLHRFSSLSTLSGNALSVVSRDPELSFADLSQAVFLDTETTGLGMGTGTYVFLVGVGYMDAGEFVVKQFFLNGPGEERAFLESLGVFLSRFPAMVTFNGKAFDWPLLESRYRLHRRAAPFDDPVHVDLLHPARRIWKRRLESCALSSLEGEILGVQRTFEDVPGWEIPFRYFRYQRSGDATPLENVFHHNLVDILSLATLAVHIDRIVSDPTCGLVREGTDFFCIGKVYELSGDAEMAAYCYDEAMRRSLPTEVRQDCSLRLGLLHKRARRWDGAIAVWESLLDEGGRSALAARVELAKYHEHVERDYDAAIEQVEHALRLAVLFDSPWPEANERDLEHRLSRLLNRSAKAGNWAGTYG